MFGMRQSRTPEKVVQRGARTSASCSALLSGDAQAMTGPREPCATCGLSAATNFAEPKRPFPASGKHAKPKRNVLATRAAADDSTIKAYNGRRALVPPQCVDPMCRQVRWPSRKPRACSSLAETADRPSASWPRPTPNASPSDAGSCGRATKYHRPIEDDTIPDALAALPPHRLPTATRCPVHSPEKKTLPLNLANIDESGALRQHIKVDDLLLCMCLKTVVLDGAPKYGASHPHRIPASLVVETRMPLQKSRRSRASETLVEPDDARKHEQCYDAAVHWDCQHQCPCSGHPPIVSRWAPTWRFPKRRSNRNTHFRKSAPVCRTHLREAWPPTWKTLPVLSTSDHFFPNAGPLAGLRAGTLPPFRRRRRRRQ